MSEVECDSSELELRYDLLGHVLQQRDLPVGDLVSDDVECAQRAHDDLIGGTQRDRRVETHRVGALDEGAVAEAGVGAGVGADDPLPGVDHQPAHRIFARVLAERGVVGGDAALVGLVDDVYGSAGGAGDVGGGPGDAGQAGVAGSLEHAESSDGLATPSLN